MVTVTERAERELGRMLASASNDPEDGLRLTVTEPGRYGIVVDKEQEGDQVVQHEGAKMLLIDEEVAGLLEEKTIDCLETTEGGPRLVLSGK